MSETQNAARNSSPAVPEERNSTPEVLLSETDEKFFESLRDFIEHEKQYLRCPAGGPDERRYSIYRSAFNKVIARATAYKRVLLAVKAEYDDVIVELKRRSDESGAAQRALSSATSQPGSVAVCQRRAAHLRDRISVLQGETAELREKLRRRQLSEEQRAWIPGLTIAESEDPGALDEHLTRLEARRAALLDGRSRRVPPEVSAELDAELRAAERRRDQMNAGNSQLKVLFKRLQLVSERLSGWEEDGRPLPLEDLLASTLRDVGRRGVTDEDARRIDAELLESDEPTGVDESKRLEGHLERFIELLDSAEYEEAALLAAGSPRGLLRNLGTMEMFEGARVPAGAPPPVLLFFQALLVTASAGERLPPDLSVQLLGRALRHGALPLATHAVTQNKLAFSEELGDALTEHAQKNPGAADACLALATVVYEACGRDRKAALSMCGRGLIHSAVELLGRCQDLAADDCMWVLCRSPSFSLLQLLTDPRPGQAAILSVGVACRTLLPDARQQRLALQLLDGFLSGGRGVLEEVILGDSRPSVDDWTEVASLCCGLGRADLSQAIRSILLGQSGTGVLSPDPEGARLMEHVFL